MSSSSRKKQDEKNLKMLREIGGQVPNRTCFDCNQKGPTYINMTVGSFVCTSCSGILRGLNPPHRVKSISMASFTPEEIDQIKSKGNKYCQSVWLNLYDGKSGKSSDLKDEHKIRDFMIMKYEKRRFYLEPSATGNLSEQTSKSETSSSASTPGSSEFVTLDLSNSASNHNGASSVSRPVPSTQVHLDPFKSKKEDIKAPNVTSFQASLDPFGLKKLSTPTPPPSLASNTNSDEGFANFENANIFSNFDSHLSNSHTSQSPAPPLPNSFTSPSFAPLTLTPTLSSSSHKVSSTIKESDHKDRYAALKSLDDEIRGKKESEVEIAPDNVMPFGSPIAPESQTTNASNSGTTPLFPAFQQNGNSNGGIYAPSKPAPSESIWDTPSFTQNANPFSTNSNENPNHFWPNNFGSSSQNQPNPFTAGKDSNLNSTPFMNKTTPEFPSAQPIGKVGNANWANFGSQPGATPLVGDSSQIKPSLPTHQNPWANNSTPTFNPFASPQVPSSGSPFNPFL